MRNLPAVLLCIAVAFLSWGTYGILVHHGNELMASPFKAFVGVGVAYFLIAVVPPVLILTSHPEKGKWSLGGSLLSLLAGSVGAFGALGIIFAFWYGGKPIYVMPLVFGCAPVVNTLVTMSLTRSFNNINPVFLVGLAMVLGGAVGVLVTKPTPSAPATEVIAAAVDATAVSEAADAAPVIKPETSIVMIVISVIAAALCWGAYGPVLHLGQARMGGSRLRPFICVGLAYFLIAVAFPLIYMNVAADAGSYTMSGMLWSIAGGAAGAIGALGIIYAFNFGGKPIFVMPLVFGFAPVVNTFVTMAITGTYDKIPPVFYVCLLTVIAGAVVVLVFAPKPAAAAKRVVAEPAPSPAT
jgi:hypothetical protein